MNTEETKQGRFNHFQAEDAIIYLEQVLAPLGDSQAIQGLKCLVWNYRQKEELSRLLSEACKTKEQQLYDALGGRSIQSEGPSDSECEGDRPKATPKESIN